VSDEDAARMLATCLQQVVRVVFVDFGERHDTRTTGQHYTPQQVGEVARHARHPGVSVVSSRMSRGCYDETAPV